MSGKFFDIESDTEKHWRGMPEMVGENREPVQQIIVSFRTFEDVQKFGELIGIKVTPKTNSTWYPKRPMDTGDHYVSDDWGDDAE